MELFPLDPVTVRFQGWRAAAGPLTVGQLNIAKWLVDAPHAPAALLDQVFPVPPGATIDDVAACLGVLLCRHEALRSHYILGEPGEQRVLTAGEVPLQVYRASGPAVAAALITQLRAKPLDVGVELPVRLAASVQDGAVVALVAVYSHLAVDFQALLVLAAEFAEMIADPAARVVGEARQQPLDRATVERRESRRRRLDQALRHWGRNLAAAPAHLYARPRAGAATGSGACGMSSEAAAQALDHIAARTKVSRPTIVLAALCALLARRTGYDTLRFVMLSANRFEASLRDYVGTLAQSTFTAVEVGDAGFDELVRRCFGAVLQSGVNGAYDVYRLAEYSEWLAAERGIAVSFEPLFNSVVVDDRGFEPPVFAGPPAQTRLAWADLPPTDILLRFDLGRVEGELVARMWSGDLGRVSRAEVTDLLLALERLLIAAAAGDLDPVDVAVALAVPPIERPAGWLLVDQCWVDLADVQRLLDEALAPAVARVFAAVDGEPLVAYVAGAGLTPAEAHRRCLALLAGRHATMAPRRYVLCERAPADVTSLEAWRAETVQVSDPGRR